jgi:hypothetical protein
VFILRRIVIFLLPLLKICEKRIITESTNYFKACQLCCVIFGLKVDSLVLNNMVDKKRAFFLQFGKPRIIVRSKGKKSYLMMKQSICKNMFYPNCTRNNALIPNHIQGNVGQNTIVC